MENQKEAITQLVLKLKVLDSRIKKLESITAEVINEVESTYQKRIKDLYKTKEAAQQKLVKLQEAGEDE